MFKLLREEHIFIKVDTKGRKERTETDCSVTMMANTMKSGFISIVSFDSDTKHVR